MKIGFKMARRMMGLTQNELKKKLGTTQSTISKIENDYFPGEKVTTDFKKLFDKWQDAEANRLLTMLNEITGLELVEPRHE